MVKKPNLKSLKEFVEIHEDIVTMSAMRDWIFKAKDSGANMWIRRLGRRIFIDVDKFFEWTERK